MTHEQARFQNLLFSFCRQLKEPRWAARGRPPRLMREAVYVAVLKVYAGLSARKMASLLADALAREHLDSPLHPHRVCHFMERSALTAALKELEEKVTDTFFGDEDEFGSEDITFTTGRMVREPHPYRDTTRWVNERVTAYLFTDTKSGAAMEMEPGTYLDPAPEGPVAAAIKERFGDHVYSRTDTAIRNEIICKVVCHDLCILLRSSP